MFRTLGKATYPSLDVTQGPPRRTDELQRDDPSTVQDAK